jgi:hypothetical protein
MDAISRCNLCYRPFPASPGVHRCPRCQCRCSGHLGVAGSRCTRCGEHIDRVLPPAVPVIAPLLALLLAIQALGAPGREGAPTGPNLNGTCRFGVVAQTGRAVTVTGPQWSATGEVRGKTLTLTWTMGGRIAHAEYLVDGGTLSGAWCWDDSDDVQRETIEIERGK